MDRWVDKTSEDYKVLESLLSKRNAVCITTIEITLELWEKMINTQRLSVTGEAKDLLLKQLRSFSPNEHGQNQGLQKWEVDCAFFPSTARCSLLINNAGENGDWGLWFDRTTLCDLRRAEALLCGIDLTLWVYKVDDELNCVAWSEYWSEVRLEVLVDLLAPSPQIPYYRDEGSTGEIESQEDE